MTDRGSPTQPGAEKSVAAGGRPSRRERVRDATLREIKEIARHHLTEHGPSGVSLRAIAREMGMTAPGLYRYFSSLDELLLSLQADFFAELDAHVATANASLPTTDLDGRILASLRAFRTWSLANRAEFTLLFGPPNPDNGPLRDCPAVEAGQRFASTFFALFDQLLRERRFTVPDEAELSPVLCRQLEAFAQQTGFSTRNVSNGALHVLTSCWVRVYGLVCMEVFEHMSFVMQDMEALFEAELRNMLTDIGVSYRAP